MANFERTCIACKTKGNKSQFIRVVKTKGNELFIEKDHKIDGRGAYLCNNEKCIEIACKNKLFNRNFKMNIGEDLYNQLKLQK